MKVHTQKTWWNCANLLPRISKVLVCLSREDAQNGTKWDFSPKYRNIVHPKFYTIANPDSPRKCVCVCVMLQLDVPLGRLPSVFQQLPDR